MTVKRKSDGKLYNIVSGRILPEENRKKEINGSFLTLRSTEDPTDEVLYIWPYWTENEYELIAEVSAGENNGKQ